MDWNIFLVPGRTFTTTFTMRSFQLRNEFFCAQHGKAGHRFIFKDASRTSSVALFWTRGEYFNSSLVHQCLLFYLRELRHHLCAEDLVAGLQPGYDVHEWYQLRQHPPHYFRGHHLACLQLLPYFHEAFLYLRSGGHGCAASGFVERFRTGAPLP